MKKISLSLVPRYAFFKVLRIAYKAIDRFQHRLVKWLETGWYTRFVDRVGEPFEEEFFK